MTQAKAGREVCPVLYYNMCEAVAAKMYNIDHVQKLKKITGGYVTHTGGEVHEAIANDPYVLVRVYINQCSVAHPEQRMATIDAVRRIVTHPLADKMLPLFINAMPPKQRCDALLACDADLTPYLAAAFFQACPNIKLWQKKIWPRLLRPCALPTDTLIHLLDNTTLPPPAVAYIPKEFIALWPDADIILLKLFKTPHDLKACLGTVIDRLRGHMRSIALAAIFYVETLMRSEAEQQATNTTDDAPPSLFTLGLPQRYQNGLMTHFNHMRVAVAYFRPFAVCAMFAHTNAPLTFFHDAYKVYGRNVHSAPPLHPTNESESECRVMRKGCSRCIFKGMALIYTHTKNAFSRENCQRRMDEESLHHNKLNFLQMLTMRGQDKMAGLWICAAEINSADLAHFIARRRMFLTREQKTFLRGAQARLAAEEREKYEEEAVQPPCKKQRIL